MTETEKKALALLNEICVEMGLDKVSSLELDMPGERALLRAIEQHEAFRIEHLEQALREIIDFGDGDTGYGNSCAKIARAALAGDSYD